MDLNFDFGSINNVEFGVGLDEDINDRGFYLVPVDPQIQGVLVDMARETLDGINRIDQVPSLYDPSDKHASQDSLYVPLNDPNVGSIESLHTAENLLVRPNAMHEYGKIFCYFVRLTDVHGNRLTGVRRSTQFKGVVKKRLITAVDDTLKLNTKPMFALDSDFDFLVDSDKIVIFRPSGFEFSGQLQEAIIAAVPANIQVLGQAIPFVNFTSIEEYASTRPRAARYIASIKSMGNQNNIDRECLEQLCTYTGVALEDDNGQLVVPDEHSMAFLEVLDRRRYGVDLTGQPERYVAAARHKV
ncbi:Kiwa anti-phage protein KwaB-like domain-containing protein [Methylophaga thiooxydans]|uniref:Kiwa anti-phage protein KwaB-like domain-containing protein n=1 Tax=Methylophaga thiooxydans TaxID=392484 RepID=UPI002354F571|nr:Kiwa anti-phage protein KwaB-like domain-containing protein [Methylophaga thiooxydans]